MRSSLGRFFHGLGIRRKGLGGIVLWRRGGRLGRAGYRERGFALLALEASDLVFETLVLLAEGQVLGVDAFHEVEECADGSARRLIRDEVEIDWKVELWHGTLACLASKLKGEVKQKGPGLLNHRGSPKG